MHDNNSYHVGRMAQRAEFDKIELYLIRVLQTLITERSVSRAAMRLQSTQPAVSAQLKRLRELTGDPLLVRAGNGMVADRDGARAASRRRTHLLQRRRAAVRRRARRSAASTRRRSTAMFRIAASDYLDPLFLPRARGAASSAPRPACASSCCRCRASSTTGASLATGDVDLVIGNWLEPPDELHLGKLFSDEIVCLVAEDHPVARSAAAPRLDGRAATSAASTSRRRRCTPARAASSTSTSRSSAWSATSWCAARTSA